MYCTTCGVRNEAGTRFCVSWGTELGPTRVPVSEGPLLASRWARLAASVIDWLLFGVPLAIIIVLALFQEFDEVSGLGVPIAILVVVVLAILVLQAVMLTRDGQTVGKKALAQESSAMLTLSAEPSPLSPSATE